MHLRQSTNRRSSRLWLISVVSVLILSVGLGAQRRGVRSRLTAAAGAPVPRVTVKLVFGGQAERTARTDSDGRFTLNAVDLARGAFRVRILRARLGAEPVRLTAESR